VQYASVLSGRYKYLARDPVLKYCQPVSFLTIGWSDHLFSYVQGDVPTMSVVCRRVVVVGGGWIMSITYTTRFCHCSGSPLFYMWQLSLHNTSSLGDFPCQVSKCSNLEFLKKKKSTRTKIYLFNQQNTIKVSIHMKVKGFVAFYE